MVLCIASLAFGISIALAATSASASHLASYVASASGLPEQTEKGQFGTNKCGTESSESSMCQNAYINSITDFCLYSPATIGNVSDHEGDVVSWCTKSGRGTRLIPEGAILGASFVYAPHYVQVTGEGDLTKINVAKGDDGGELDPHGATGEGNPVGGLVFHCTKGKCIQMHEWAMFMSDTEFCFRACYDGDRATSLCRHTYDTLGCRFNMPANYPDSYFETCDSEDAQDIAYYDGHYFAQDMTKQGVPVPDPHPPPATSNCKQVDGVSLYGDAGPNAFNPPASNKNVATSSAFDNSTIAASSSKTPPGTNSTDTSTSTTTDPKQGAATAGSMNTSSTTTTPSDGFQNSSSTTTSSDGTQSSVSGAVNVKIGFATVAGLVGILAGTLLL